MTVKTFTSTTLSAADTNEFLANSGLVYVSSTTWVGTSTSVPVNSCFSATYDNYRVVMSNFTASATAELLLKFNNSTGSTYSHGGVYVQYGSNTVFGEQASNVSTGIRVGNSNTTTSNIVFDVFSPFLAAQTGVTSNHADSTFWSVRGGRDSNAVSQTGMSLAPSSGTISGGTITVYGYRKA
jgi:hypothetical protein